MDAFEEKLASALTIDLPYEDQSRREFNAQFPSAVLVLIGHLTQENTRSLLYIQRTETVETHKGQAAFPGGISEPEDQGEDAKTALRETQEEVGISPDSITVLGKLP